MPQGYFNSIFSKSREEKIGCLYSSRTRILAYICDWLNAVIRDMRGMRELREKKEGLPANNANQHE